jgi:Tfp pilus assembly protein PilF
VRLDDALPEAHAALAWVRMYVDWDWRAAEQAVKRALAISPACTDAHHLYAHWHEKAGHLDLAVAEMETALALEPVAPALHSCLVQILFHARRYDEAVQQSRVTLELAPDFAGTFGWMGMAHLLCGRADLGVELIREGLGQRPGDPRLEALLATACALSGRNDEAKESLARLAAIAGQRYVDPYFMVWPNAALGDHDTAISWLTRACEERSQWAWVFEVDPLVDVLRPDPRYRDAVRPIGVTS